MAFRSSDLNIIAPALMVDDSSTDILNFHCTQRAPPPDIAFYSQQYRHQEQEVGQIQDGSYSDDGPAYEEYITSSYQHQHHLHHHPQQASRAIPMPMPGIVDPPLQEMDYMDTPYQLKPLGRSLSAYTEYDESILAAVGPAPSLSATSTEEGIEVKASDSSESQAYYGTENIVRELRMEYVRWFYKSDADRKWIPFTGFDSMRIEARHRDLALQEEEQTSSQRQNSEGEFRTSSEKLSDSLDRSTPPTTSEPVTGNESSSGGRKYSLTSSGTIPHHPLSSSTSPAPSFENLHNQTDSNNGTSEYHRRSSGPTSSNNTTTKKRTYRSYARASKDNSSSSFSNPGSAPGVGSSKWEFPGHRAQWPPVSPPLNPENIIVVRGGLYEVNLEHIICYATYWPDMCSIRRGTWFYDGSWEPIESAHADKLEAEHLDRFGGTSLSHSTFETLPESPTKKSKQVQHRISFPDFHVDWFSASEIHLYSKAVPHKLMRSVGQKLGFQTGGHRICRGYFKQCMLSDRPAEINHVVFVVHGIGQKMDTGRIVRNCAALRECVAALKKQFYPYSELSRQRAEFFPVEWRSAAKLDGDIVDAITPHKLLGLRQMLNATAMDIMYYTSPLYRTEIQNALRSELNRIYSNFVKRNPNFEARGGKVSVLAHSLGAVITYDIMTGYISPLRSDCPELRSIELSGVDTSEEINHEGILVIDDITSDKMPEQPRLLFKLEHFFCLGSPLAVFLALRWKEPHNPDLRGYILPPSLSKRVYNVFHPSDPVAYRLEPLLNKAYVKIAPLLIHSSGASSVPKYDEMERELICREVTNPNKPETVITASSPPTIITQPDISAAIKPSVLKPSNVASNASNSISSLANSVDTNWGWLNPLKLWKSPENQTDGNFSINSSGISMNLNRLSPYHTTGEPGVLESENMQNHGILFPPGETSKNVEDNSAATAVPDETEDTKFLASITNDLEYRMDYVLRESNLSSSYLAALTSHTSYWSNPDVAFFVLTHLYNGTLETQYDNH